MSYHNFEPESREGKIGKAIYLKALDGRRGFRYDQIGIEGEEIWSEIFVHMGLEALKAVADTEPA